MLVPLSGSWKCSHGYVCNTSQWTQFRVRRKTINDMAKVDQDWVQKRTLNKHWKYGKVDGAIEKVQSSNVRTIQCKHALMATTIESLWREIFTERSCSPVMEKTLAKRETWASTLISTEARCMRRSINHKTNERLVTFTICKCKNPFRWHNCKYSSLIDFPQQAESNLATVLMCSQDDSKSHRMQKGSSNNIVRRWTACKYLKYKRFWKSWRRSEVIWSDGNRKESGVYPFAVHFFSRQQIACMSGMQTLSYLVPI